MEAPTKVYIRRIFNCSPEALFPWFVDAALIAQWFGPPGLRVVHVESDVRIGGFYRIELRKPNASHFCVEGQYAHIRAPYDLDFTMMYAGLPESPPESLVQLRFESIESNRSRLTLTQQFDVVPSDMEHRTKAWEHMFGQLSTQVDKT